ncbi:MAG: HAMP domain-containing protein [Anaerolineae bacterium]|nr:HAMP domain-containing protein [Anaerolineae bacterium]
MQRSVIRRSLAAKLVLAFLLVSVTGVALAALFARWATYREFEQLILERTREEYVERVTAYYEENRSWVGIAQYMYRPATQPPQNEVPLDRGQPNPQPTLAFILVNERDVVVAPGGPFHPGDRPPAPLIAGGIPIEVDGVVVGTVVTTGNPPEIDPREQAYLARTNRASVYAALAATGIALVLGVWLARTLTRPLRALTQATRAVATGDLEQQVAVRSRDELGELATAFNQMSADLAQANQARRQMTADIAHDLRSPLTVIGGYLEALRDGVLQPTPARFEAMYQESQYLLRLVEDLRTLSLADAGELILNRVAVPPRALLKRLAATYQLAAEQQEITMTVDVPGDLPDIIVDPDRMIQVLGNLVSNALRYTPEGGQIALGAKAVGGAVALTVADTGSGIPSEALPRIFDRFYRVDASREEHEGESGLGLAIARSLVEAHGGAIAVASAVGEGTTFTLTLPA